VGIVVERPLLRRFLLSGGRRLLYGRRKTGKTFYARRVLSDYQYFIVRRGGSFYDPFSDVELDVDGFIRLCRVSDRIIVDEFHRASSKFFDAIHAGACGGELVLITSTLHYYRRLVEGADAPLHGLFAQARVGLLSPLELLSTGGWGFESPSSLLEHLTFYQEPSLIGWRLPDIVVYGRELAHSLVGEVLDEEDYTYTRRFDAILEALAAGRTRLSEIAGYLYSRGLIPTQSTSHVTKYLNIMCRVGLVERVEVWGKRRGSIYRHVSPLTEAVYYLEARYGLGETPIPRDYIARALDTIIPRLVERFVERTLSEYYGLKPVKILEPEIDIALTEFKRIRLVAEVKWKRGLDRSEVRKVEEKLARFPDAEKILIVPDATIVPETWLEVWDVNKLRRIAAEWRAKSTTGQ
jgi:hypothetical protein